MAYPLVSIVLNYHNRFNYLEEAIISVLNQTYTNWELILYCITNAPLSNQITERYAAADSRIRLFNVVADISFIQANKNAHDLAQGKYICVVDSDDLLEVNALEVTVKFLEAHPQAGMVYSNCYVINEAGRIYGARNSDTDYSFELQLKKFITFHFRLIRKSAFDLAGGISTSGGLIAYDYELCLRLGLVTQIAKVNNYLYFFRLHPENVYSNKTRQAQRKACVEIASRYRSRVKEALPPYQANQEKQLDKDRYCLPPI